MLHSPAGRCCEDMPDAMPDLVPGRLPSFALNLVTTGPLWEEQIDGQVEGRHGPEGYELDDQDHPEFNNAGPMRSGELHPVCLKALNEAVSHGCAGYMIGLQEDKQSECFWTVRTFLRFSTSRSGARTA